ncbi:Aldehyde/histidinol dehydrogenase, partial [Baffinella frigidus]
DVLCRVPCATQAEMEAIVQSAIAAAKKWRETPVQQRCRVLIKLHSLLVANQGRIADVIVAENGQIKADVMGDVFAGRIADVIVAENGKTKADAMGDVFRGIEVVEHAIAMPSMTMGESMEQISTNMDTHTMRQPLGVVAGIAPFNFPAMIVLWMLPIAIGTGNAFILKPSERVPGAARIIAQLTAEANAPVFSLWAARIIAQLTAEAGLPKGVFSLLHGGKEAVDFLCTHAAIRAVSFVGSGHVGKIVHSLASAAVSFVVSDHVGKIVHSLASAAGKRVQCNMGAKNHAVVLPYCNAEQTLNGIIGAAFGAAGQRCMAIRYRTHLMEVLGNPAE